MQLFEAFRDRLRRGLNDMIRDAEGEFVAINSDCASKGQFNSGYRIARLMAAVAGRFRAATEWAFFEVLKLPGKENITRELSLPILKEDLGRFSYQLIDAAGLSDPSKPLTPSTGRLVQTETERMHQAFAGDLRDLEAGLWSPRPQPQPLAHATHNVIHVEGDLHGAVQQAGAGSHQEAHVVIDQSSVVNALDELMAAVARLEIDPDARNDIEVDAETIRQQLRKRSPSAAVLRAAGQSLATVALGVGANLLTPQVQVLLAALGVG